MSTQLKCGFCDHKCYAMDLYSHVMTHHTGTVEHLSEEAQKAWVNSGTSDACCIESNGVRCTKKAIVMPRVRIFTLDRKTRLHNPTPGPNVSLDLPQGLCVDHAEGMTAKDLIRVNGRDSILEEQLAIQRSYYRPDGTLAACEDGLMIDWLRPSPHGGDSGPELIFVPIVPIPTPS